MSRRSLEVWKDRTLEVAWMVLPCQTNPTATAWPLDPRRLEQVLIRWPSSYQWPLCVKWVESLLQGFRRFVKTEIAEIRQPYNGIVIVSGLLHC